MILEKGDMWSVFDKSDLWCFTGNASINVVGQLVMGRGMALEVKQRIPQSTNEFGKQLGDWWDMGVHATYGFFWYQHERHRQIGVFQVKYRYSDKALYSLIGYSARELVKHIEWYNSEGAGHEDKIERVDLNFPGIGYGGLDRDYVLPIIKELPDVVHVWEHF